MKARRPMISGVLVWAGLILLGMQGPGPGWSQGGGSSVFQSYAKLQPLPDFSLEDLRGGMVPIQKFKGQVILLHFWATW